MQLHVPTAPRQVRTILLPIKQLRNPMAPITHDPSSPRVRITNQSTPIKEKPSGSQASVYRHVAPLGVCIHVLEGETIGDVVAEIEDDVPAGV